MAGRTCELCYANSDRLLDTDEARQHGLAGGDYVRVGVEDPGPGIPPAIRGHVFEPFFTTKDAGDGKGPGLPIAYSLVRGWNGNLSLAPAAGEGARFEFLIPVDDPEGNEAGAATARPIPMAHCRRTRGRAARRKRRTDRRDGGQSRPRS